MAASNIETMKRFITMEKNGTFPWGRAKYTIELRRLLASKEFEQFQITEKIETMITFGGMEISSAKTNDTIISSCQNWWEKAATQRGTTLFPKFEFSDNDSLPCDYVLKVEPLVMSNVVCVDGNDSRDNLEEHTIKTTDVPISVGPPELARIAHWVIDRGVNVGPIDNIGNWNVEVPYIIKPSTKYPFLPNIRELKKTRIRCVDGMTGQKYLGDPLIFIFENDPITKKPHHCGFLSDTAKFTIKLSPWSGPDEGAVFEIYNSVDYIKTNSFEFKTVPWYSIDTQGFIYNKQPLEMLETTLPILVDDSRFQRSVLSYSPLFRKCYLGGFQLPYLKLIGMVNQ